MQETEEVADDEAHEEAQEDDVLEMEEAERRQMWKTW